MGGDGDDKEGGETLLEAVGSADMEVEAGDVESQLAEGGGQEGDRDGAPTSSSSALDQPPPPSATAASSTVEKPLSTTSDVGLFAYDEDDTASVFSFDSLERQPRVPLRVQNMMRKKQQGGTDDPESSAVPFPSVVNASMEYEDVVNVCPCRCLFFTLKEAVCLVMSALGCAVFMTGLVLLCMYLEGSFPPSTSD